MPSLTCISPFCCWETPRLPAAAPVTSCYFSVRVASGGLCLPRKAGAALELTSRRGRALHSPVAVAGSSSWQPPHSSSRQISAQQSRGKSIVGLSNCLGKITPFPHVPQRAAGKPRGTAEDFAPFSEPSSEANQRWQGTTSQAGTMPLFPPGSQSLIMAN